MGALINFLVKIFIINIYEYANELKKSYNDCSEQAARASWRYTQRLHNACINNKGRVLYEYLDSQEKTKTDYCMLYCTTNGKGGYIIFFIFN